MNEEQQKHIQHIQHPQNISSIPQPVWQPVVQQPIQQPAQQSAPQPTPQQHTVPQQPVITPRLKKGRRISLRGFLIGCSLFFLLILWIVWFSWYYFLQNPDQLGGALDITTIRDLLIIFSLLFFGGLFFAGLSFLVLNVYRLATIKEGRKIGYWVGAIIGFFLVWVTVVWWTYTIDQINDIAGRDVVTSNDIVLVQVPFRWGPQYAHTLNAPLIAPASLRFDLNIPSFERARQATIGSDQIQQVRLDCGNEQSVWLLSDGIRFGGSCLYEKKWDYPLTLVVTHIDRTTNETRETLIPSQSVTFNSEITISTSEWPYTLNDPQTEIILWQAPIKTFFDATAIFTDLSLPEFRILRDLDGDGETDKENDTSFAYQYRQPRLQQSYFSLPAFGGREYELQLRVLQGDVPICEVIATNQWETKYSLSTLFDDTNTPIVDYRFDIIDLSTNRSIETIPSKNGKASVEFPNGWGSYSAKVTFITDEGKTGRCETDTIEIGSVDFDVSYIIDYTSPWSPRPTALTDEWEAYRDGDTIVISRIPTILMLDINRISPSSNDVTLSVALDNTPILPVDKNMYEITINTPQEQYITITVSDKNSDATTSIELPIRVQVATVRWTLLALPDTVGTDPFDVSLDASTISISDSDDEIIYFSRFFGDGVENLNSTQGKITHTYKYDYRQESWEYRPYVVITTKKWVEQRVDISSPLFVKKPTRESNIRVNSHPAQIALAWETISLSLTTDWLPTQMVRDFDNGKTLECEGRECVDVTALYDQPGTYVIKTTVTFDDNTTTNATVKIIVE